MAAERELFIYWKVATADAPLAVAEATAWLERLRALQPALVARLYQRADPNADARTVMETYALPGTGLDEASIERYVAEGAALLGRWARGGRHVEVFEMLAPHRGA
jgi:Domain of unknown function (DUF4936)